MLRKMKTGDKILIVTVSALVIAGAMVTGFVRNNTKSPVVIVSVDGKEYGRYRIDKDTQVSIDTEYGHNVLVIEDGYAYISEADCKDKICKKHAKVNQNREQIICLPHRLVVEVKSQR
ncbi:MAG: NusG domain II-containing protein [Lachnospiraceae bacterium]|uniref:NusG domain II-containing protein n=1 Tax=Falcatimonas sp. MSJ-15 TaxID=2841515 RepID=UPI001C10B843|nr:NusG domain II-containing protein [Falcatimonas sp. MSJ-15]MBQ5734655.1 NusG domain II-containing protein [Lachnospiraceae bacterium]MBU5471349.1 NusG domain II-containing protein [Falcatimonas sp. MSJ-15]